MRMFDLFPNPDASLIEMDGEKRSLAQSLQQLDDTTFNELHKATKVLKARIEDIAKQNQDRAARKQQAADDEAYSKNSFARISGNDKVGRKTAEKAGARLR